MGLLRLNFDKLPISTMVGADRATFRTMTQGGAAVDPEYLRNYRTTKFLRALLDPAYRINDRRAERMDCSESVQAPVFILGHWRSGTTFLHNILSCDERFGCCTTYQTVFPHLMLWGQPFFKWWVDRVMPARRPTDAMELGSDLPQEEEFALSNMTPHAYYHFWIFPRRMTELRDKYLLMNTITEPEREEFKRALDRLIRISLRNTGRSRYLSKNPPHTGRIRTLLEMYPDAKFIYLMRNPYTVYESTTSFFNNMMPSICWQTIPREELQWEILKTYTALHEKYEAEKGLIPAGNLIEMRFEEVEAAPLETAEQIYRTLSLGGFEEARPAMERHLEGHKGFRKNRYHYTPETLHLVEEHWGAALKQWSYVHQTGPVGEKKRLF